MYLCPCNVRKLELQDVSSFHVYHKCTNMLKKNKVTNNMKKLEMPKYFVATYSKYADYISKRINVIYFCFSSIQILNLKNILSKHL